MRYPQKQPPSHPQTCMITTPQDSRQRSPPPPHTHYYTNRCPEEQAQFLSFSPFRFCSPQRYEAAGHGLLASHIAAAPQAAQNVLNHSCHMCFTWASPVADPCCLKRRRKVLQRGKATQSSHLWGILRAVASYVCPLACRLQIS
jgi:hypothetical protein